MLRYPGTRLSVRGKYGEYRVRNIPVESMIKTRHGMDG